jgi:hypothetical protein
MYMNRAALRNVFSVCREAIKIPDPTFRRYANIVTASILLSAILENAVGHYHLFSPLDPGEAKDCAARTLKRLNFPRKRKNITI